MELKYKTLRHKILIHTFAHFMRDFKDEIFYSKIPTLLSPNTTMEKFRRNLQRYPNALKKLDEYELVDVNIKL